jgi:hypothetical protein
MYRCALNKTLDIFMYGPRREGFAFLPFIVGLALLGTLVGVGVSLIKPRAKIEKVTQTQENMDAMTRTLLGWTVLNKRLPDSTEFSSVVEDGDDAWRKPFVYVYDGDLISSSGWNVCGKNTTNITSGATSNIAFSVISGGDDYRIDSSAGTSGAYTGELTLSPEDLSRVVGLEELKNYVNCYGSTEGRLRIVNKELPEACSGAAYTAALYAQGGVSPYSWSYVVPPWFNGPVASGDSLQFSGTPLSTGTDLVTATASDSEGNAVQRRFPILIRSCGGGGRRISFEENFDGFPGSDDPGGETHADAGLDIDADSGTKEVSFDGAYQGDDTRGCLWYQGSGTDSFCDDQGICPAAGTEVFTGLKAYFKFTVTAVDCGPGCEYYPDGFTFSVLGANGINQDLIRPGDSEPLCGSPAEDLGYSGCNEDCDGRSYPVMAPKAAVEFDSWRWTNQLDGNIPSSQDDHVAIVYWGKWNQSSYDDVRHDWFSGGGSVNNIWNPDYQAPPAESAIHTGSGPGWLKTTDRAVRVNLDWDKASRTLTTEAWVDCQDCDDLDTDPPLCAPPCYRIYHETSVPAALTDFFDKVRFGWTYGASRGGDLELSDFELLFLE